VGHDAAYNTGYGTRGNQTNVTRYANASAQTGALTSTKHYDIAGNTSHISYADSFSDLNDSRHTYSLPKDVISPAPNPAAEYGFPAGTFGSLYSLTSSAVYDFNTGLAVSMTNANGKVTTFDYSDPLGRLKRVDRPDGGWTTYNYSSAANNPSGVYYVEAYTALDSSRSNYASVFFDGMGRESRTLQYFGGGRSGRARTPTER
jgi:YD repeat-containing protein